MTAVSGSAGLSPIAVYSRELAHREISLKTIETRDVLETTGEHVPFAIRTAEVHTTGREREVWLTWSLRGGGCNGSEDLRCRSGLRRTESEFSGSEVDGICGIPEVVCPPKKSSRTRCKGN